MARFGVVTNPHAGGNRRDGDERTAALSEALGGEGSLHEPATFDELDHVVCQLRSEEIDVLGVCGGDGSFFRVLTAMKRAYGDAPLPAFLPLRGGSMNTIARSVGHASGEPAQVLGSAVNRSRAGEPLRTAGRQLVEVNGEQLGFLVGCGVVVRFLEYYYSHAGRGPLAAAGVAVKVIANALAGSALARQMFRGYDARVHTDSEPLSFSHYSILFAAGVAELGLGFRVAYLADRKPGFFHLLTGDPGPVEAGMCVPHLKFGWPTRLESLYDNLAREVSVEFQQPTQYMVDGDILEPVERLQLRSGPWLRIIQQE